MFFNNGDKMEIPCLWSMDDSKLINHIGRFYYLRKAEKGIIEALGMKVLQFIEIVRVSRDG
jgi:hypothetical protein